MNLIDHGNGEFEIRGFDGCVYKIITIKKGKAFTRRYNTIATETAWSLFKNDTLRVGIDDDSLKASILSHGLAEPIHILNGIHLISGWRRLKAFHELNLPLIPVT